MNDMREMRAAVVAAGFSLPVNQAGPLLEQMVKRAGPVYVSTAGEDYVVMWKGNEGTAASIFEAALRCVHASFSKSVL